MQLNMVTPMDIGLERQDGVDDSDMFDLGEAEREAGGSTRKSGTTGGFVTKGIADADEMLSDDEEDEERDEAAIEEEDEELLDSDDEAERKTRLLEASLDAAYDQYHAHKLERDAKHRVKEERRKREAAEGGEWHGIQEKVESSDEEDLDADPAPLPSSDEEDSDDEVDMPGDEDEDGAGSAPKPSKRALKAAAELERKQQQKSKKLLTDLKVAKEHGDETKRLNEKTRAAKIWFDQPVFKGLKGMEGLMSGVIEDDEQPNGEASDDDGDEEDVWAGVESGAEDDAALELSVRFAISQCTLLDLPADTAIPSLHSPPSSTMNPTLTLNQTTTSLAHGRHTSKARIWKKKQTLLPKRRRRTQSCRRLPVSRRSARASQQ